MRIGIKLIVLLLLLGCNHVQKEKKDVYSGVMYYGGEIVTMEGTEEKTTEAVVTIGDSIAFTGSKAEAVLKFPQSKPYNLNGKVLLPGLIDNHLHPGLGGFLLPLHWITPEDWHLANNREIKATLGKENFLNEVKKLVDTFKPEDKVLQIFGYSQFFHGTIYKEDLDKLSTTVPINLFHRSFHENIFNSPALAFYGYTRENMNDPQADFDKGLVLENFQQLDFLYKRWLPTFALEDWKAGLSDVMELLLENGVTTVHGPGGFLGATPEQIDAMYKAFSKSAARSFFSADIRPWFLEGGFENVIANIDKTAKQNDAHIIYQTDQIKLFLDGGMFSQQMMVTQPYTDGHTGEYITKPDALYTFWKPFWKQGIDVHIHINGDRGVDDLLRIVEQLQKEHPRADHRTVIEHFGVSRSEQASKMKVLGITASVNPYYVTALGENFTKTGVGPESRSHYFSRSGSLAKNDIPFSLHSDFPMAPPSPLYLMWCAVNRKGVSGKTLGAEEKITAYQALRAVTIDAAYAIKQEHLIGSIKVGKKADFTIVDKNPLKVDPMQIKDIKVATVVFDGVIHATDSKE